MNRPEQSDDQEFDEYQRERRRQIRWIFFTRPWLIIHLFAGFCTDWVYSRRLAALLAGLPAAFAVLAPLVVLAIGRHQTDSKMVERYSLAARKAIDAKDDERADLLLERLIQMCPSDDHYRFLRASCAERQEQPDRARQLMQQIAPLDGRGYAQAYFWLAQDLAKNGDTSDPRVAAQIERYLTKTLERAPNFTSARQALTQEYVLQKRFQEAIKTWKSMRVRDPGYWLTLAQLNRACDQEKEAMSAASKAVEQCEANLKENPRVARSYAALARAKVFQGDYSQAVQTLLGALKQCEPSTRLFISKQIAMTYANWYDSLPEDQSEQRLELMTEAMRFAPNHPAVLTRLADLTTKLGTDTDAFEPLRQSLESGAAPAAVHLLLGTAAIQTDPDKALHHLELALEHRPNSSVTLNNLAWTWAHMPNADLQRAEKLADAAIKLAPQYIEFRDTRGQIRAMRGDTTGAIADLEYVIQQEPDRRSAHELLATLYEEMGLEDMAAASRQRAAKLDDSKP